MKIHNLEINILYCLCDPVHGGHEDRSKAVADIVDAFSDIPVGELMSTMSSGDKHACYRRAAKSSGRRARRCISTG